MDIAKKQIIDVFLQKGHLLTQDALEYLYNSTQYSEDWVSSFLDRKFDGVIVTRKELEPKEKFGVIKSLDSKPDRADATQYFNSKYSKMKDIVFERIKKEFVSINRLPSYRQEIFVIGMIKDKREGDTTTVEIEDPTGSVNVVFKEKAECGLDDVVAIQGVSGGKVIFGKKIIYPDVPLRTPTKGKGRGCFISDIHLDETPKSDLERFFQRLSQENVNYLFVAGDVGNIKIFEDMCGELPVFLVPGNADAKDDYPQLPIKTEKRNMVSLSNPAMVEIGGLKILMIHKFSIDMLKKRHLGESTAINEDYLVLDEIPDIVHYGNNHKALISNYKSITLVNSGSLLTEFKPVIIDFETRDARQISL